MTQIALGSDSLVTLAKSIKFADGTIQATAASTPPRIEVGSAPFAGSSSSAVTFPTTFVAATAPVVLVCPQGGLGPIPTVTNITVNGTAGAYTGFTLTLSSSWTAGGYNYIAVGTPN